MYLYFSDTGRSHGDHCPLSVTSGLLHLTSIQELFLRNLTSYGQSMFPLGWLLPTQHRWPDLHSHLGQLSGWWWLWWPPHLPQLLCLCHTLLHLLWGWRGFHLRNWGVCWHWGYMLSMYHHPGSNLQVLPTLPHSVFFLCLSHTGKENNQSEARAASWESCDICCESIGMSIFEKYYKSF